MLHKLKEFFHLQPLSQPKCEAHLFPFLNDDSDLACFYKKICHAMISVSQSQENIDALTKLAKERFGARWNWTCKTLSYYDVFLVQLQQ